MSEPIDLSSDQCKLVARQLRTLLNLFDPPRDKRGVVAGPSRVQASFRAAWGWQLEPSSATADVDDPDGNLNPDDLKPSPGTLPSGIRGKGGHGDPTLAAVMATLGRRDDRDLSYKMMMADLETVGDSVAKLICDVVKVTPELGSAALRNKRDPKNDKTEKECTSEGCRRMQKDAKSRHCAACADFLNNHPGVRIVPRANIASRDAMADLRERNRVKVSGPDAVVIELAGT